VSKLGITKAGVAQLALQDNLLCLAVVPNIYIPSTSLLFTNGSLETSGDFQASICEPITSLMGCRCGASTVFGKDEPLKLQGFFGHLAAAKLSNLLAERNPAFRRAQSLFSFHGMILWTTALSTLHSDPS
jgi:hypothetical protein